MSIAPRLQRFMEKNGIDYEIMPHDREVVASKIAQAAHISGNAMAKGVLLKSDHGYMMAVVPASHHVDLQTLSHRAHERLGLATEAEACSIFDDCDAGAVPACGSAYGMPMIIDTSLDDQDELYLEAGDHRNLLHIDRQAFAKLTADSEHARISRPH
ncbi:MULTISPECIES: aminoacyl-tRNA deacylase [Kordiimonas]|uniref:Ala-tRNA(Pro) deacylase n=1 Tax=Kordiimonas lacus TaxID=637679 RepID=A0A1G7BIC6_9PROT|nr:MULTISPECIES: YbaK/EbsC family protein [Kordiimonas]SDE26470.1 Ala-tRNA(Pro) deacylase [Kordiimonas lacus]